MCEIRVRAWDNVAKRMSYGTLEQFDDMLGIRFDHFETDAPIYMLSTGLKDKNGKEIYDGDILRDRESYDEIYHYKVIWHVANACFYFKDLFGDYECFQGEDLYLNQIEVVGNIYETPEFVEVKG